MVLPGDRCRPSLVLAYHISHQDVSTDRDQTVPAPVMSKDREHLNQKLSEKQLNLKPKGNAPEAVNTRIKTGHKQLYLGSTRPSYHSGPLCPLSRPFSTICLILLENILSPLTDNSDFTVKNSIISCQEIQDHEIVESLDSVTVY